MQSFSKLFTLVSALASLGHATPQYHRTLSRALHSRQEGSAQPPNPQPQPPTTEGSDDHPGTIRPPTTEELADPSWVCGQTYDDPNYVWNFGGAADFLQQWLDENGADNWANKIDQSTTADGSQGESNLNCAAVGASNCAFPTIQCVEFTPPALFHVRQAMATAHAMLKAVHEKLQDTAITESLYIDHIVSDFGPAAAPSTAILGAMNGAFTIAAGIGSGSAPAAGLFSIIAGLFGLIASDGTAESIDPTMAIKDQLSASFTAADKHLATLAQTVFGGVSESSGLPGDNEVDRIVKFFSGGKYLIPVDARGGIDTEVETIMDAAKGKLRQRLVNAALKDQNYYIFVDLKLDEGGCGETGSRFIDGQCFRIQKPFDYERNKIFGESIDADMISKFDDPEAGYNIDVDQFYRIADACQNANWNYDGDISTEGLPTNGDYPDCFFNLPVIKADSSVCIPVIQDGVELPENLGINSLSCDPPGDSGPGSGSN